MSKKEEIVKKRLTSKKIKQVTEGVFSTAFDVSLFLLSLPILSLGTRPSSRGVHQTFDQAHELLEEINYKKFQHALQILRRKGLINSLEDWLVQPIITNNGRKRLKKFLPEYDAQRPWRGKLYLISYDFPIKKNRLRDLFREYIKRLGAIKLQESLYLTPNNPYKFIEDFQKEHRFAGTVLVSELSKRGFLGKDDLKMFLWQVSGLEKVNARYLKFIEKYKKGDQKMSLFNISLEYYSILKDDPQLPFELLPEDYLGDEAYFLFRKSTNPKES